MAKPTIKEQIKETAQLKKQMDEITKTFETNQKLTAAQTKSMKEQFEQLKKDKDILTKTVNDRLRETTLGKIQAKARQNATKQTREIYTQQKTFAEKYIPEEYRHGMITTFSLNRYSVKESKAMSVHSDGADVLYTTMSCHRKGEYEGAYLSFPRWKIGINLPHNSVCIADSKSLHTVTPIRGEGTRYTTVCYTDKSCATVLKSERLIGKHAKKESGSLEDFL